MSDKESKKKGKQGSDKSPTAAEKPTIIRITLKDKEYRLLSKTASKRGCTPEELVERCVQNLLDA